MGKFLPQKQMRVIRWETAIANRDIKARGQVGKEYVSFGCGCCFVHVKRAQEEATAVAKRPPSRAEIMVQDTARYLARG